MLIGIDASRAVIAQRTGTEVYSLHLIRSLIKLDAAHRFRLYFNARPPERLFPVRPGDEQRVIPFPRLWTHLRLSAEVLVHPPDVLFVPAHVLPLIHPRRSVVTIHDLGHRYHPETHTVSQLRYLEWSTRFHVRTAAHLLTDSQATRDDLARLYGADPARMTVAYLGVDPALARVDDPATVAAVKARCGISGPYLLYVGTLQPRKNLVRLIEAFVRLIARDESGVTADLQLVLVGKRGWMDEPIQSRARELGIEGRVVLPGYVPQADLPALYSGAAVFCMPSLYEGFCMPVLEAMACGVPVACSRTSSLPEVVQDAAIMFEPEDVEGMAAAMGALLADEPLRIHLVTRGTERVKNFSWRRCAWQVLDVLEQVAVGSPRGADHA